MAERALLEAHGLSKSFGGVRAVDDLSLSVMPGRMLALMGPNGAGKSTTFNLLNGQLKPDTGEVHIAGQRVLNHDPQAIWQMGVGRTFQIAQTFMHLPALVQIQLALVAKDQQLGWGWWRGLFTPLAHQCKDEAMHHLSQLGLADQAWQTPASMSYGWVKRLELALCLCQRPRVLLMDEPTTGLGRDERISLMQTVRRLTHDEGIAVVFTEHSLDAVFGFADDMVLMAHGRLVAQGHPDEVRRMPEAKAVYFGGRE